VLAYQRRSELNTESPGLNFTYGRIVTILHKLTERGSIDAPLVVQQDTLSERIARLRISDTPEHRPETAAEKVSTSGR